MPRIREHSKLAWIRRNIPAEFMAVYVGLEKLTRDELAVLSDAIYNYGGRRARQEREEIRRTGGVE